MALKTFLEGQHCFTLLRSGFGKSPIKHRVGCVQGLAAGVVTYSSCHAVTSLNESHECDGQKVRPIIFQVLPPPSKCFLLTLYWMDV